MASDQDRVGLAEFTAALSLAADQAAGLSPGHGLRTCLLATGLARRAGLAADDLRHVYYTALLRSVGCTSDAHEQAELFGDEIAARTRLNLAPYLAPRELLGVLARHAGAGEPPVRRAAALGRTLAVSRGLPRRVAAAHCETAQRLSGRLSLPGSVSGALHAVFERWDGGGFPDGRAGPQIPVPARFAQLSYDALLLQEHFGGIGQIAKLAGACYDPDVASLLTAGDTAEATEIVSPWEAVLAAEPAGADDELVRRLRAAGCVVIGKTQMPELAIWPFTEPRAYPATRNPWDTARTPGGSTGGGAAALASGMAALALGSDGGGSIRIPAACCGVVGLKPGPGVVPLAGGADSHWYGLTACGPLARTAGDAAAALAVLTGTAPRATPAVPDRPLRIAYSATPAAFGARLDPSVRAAVEDTAAALRENGHQLVRARPPIPANLGLRFMSRWLAGIAQDAAGLPAGALEERTAKMARRGQRTARKVKPASADPFAARAARWISDFDALITPTLTRPAVPLGTWAGKGWFPTALSVGNWLCTTPWNLAGLPAISVPARTGGLPAGVQIVAPAGGENVILSIAAELERLRPWPQLAPLAAAG